MSCNLFTEALESRMLMSASPASEPLSHAVQADRAQIQQDLLKFKSDALSNLTTMLADIAAVKADHPENATTVMPLIGKFRSDEESMWSQLRIDRLGENQNALSDESVIVGDMKQVMQDRRNPTKRNADYSKMRADRAHLQQDIIAGLTARLTTRQNACATLSADLQAIVTAAESDPNASPQLVTDLQKAMADKTTCLNTMTADIQTLIADRSKLVADLTAMQTV